jgi:mannose-6-phosphate isomerase-like protein (cupin superfamily)
MADLNRVRDVRSIFIRRWRNVSFLSEGGVYKVGNELIDIKPNTFLRIRPGVRHYIKNTDDSNLEFVYFGVAIEKI